LAFDALEGFLTAPDRAKAAPIVIIEGGFRRKQQA
jgi:hypothetical protein